MGISEEEIEESLLKGSGTRDGKFRIYQYFIKEHDRKDYKKFLKDEYGIGGWCGAFKNYFYSSLDHDAKGIKITKTDNKLNKTGEIFLIWDKVAEIIKELVNNDKYLSKEEKIKYQIKVEVEGVRLMEELQPAVKNESSFLSLENATKKINETMDKVKDDFMYIAFLLWEVNHFKYYEAKGYCSAVEYAEKELGFKQASTYNFISICDKFSEKRASGYPTMHLDDKFKDYNFTQLVEIKSLKVEQLSSITPDMSKKQIREKKKELKSNENNIIDVEFKQDQVDLKENQIVIEEVIVPDEIEKVRTNYNVLLKETDILRSNFKILSDENSKLVQENEKVKKENLKIKKEDQIDLVENQTIISDVILDDPKEKIIKYFQDRLVILKKLAKDEKPKSLTENCFSATYYEYLGAIHEVDLILFSLERDQLDT